MALAKAASRLAPSLLESGTALRGGSQALYQQCRCAGREGLPPAGQNPSQQASTRWQDAAYTAQRNLQASRRARNELRRRRPPPPLDRQSPMLTAALDW